MSVKRFVRRALLWCGIAGLALANLSANALGQEIKVTRQYGLPYLPLMVMEHEHLFEKHLKALGAGDAKVTWATMPARPSSVHALWPHGAGNP